MVLEPLPLRVVSRVVVFPRGPVVVALVWPGLRSTWREAKVLPGALVVLDDTSPWARLTSRVAALPLAPATVVWRSRARAGWVTMAVRHKQLTTSDRKARCHMLLSFCQDGVPKRGAWANVAGLFKFPLILKPWRVFGKTFLRSFGMNFQT